MQDLMPSGLGQDDSMRAHLLELAQAQLGVGPLGGGVHEGDGQLLHLALQVLGLALQPRRLLAAHRQLALQILPGLDVRCTTLAPHLQQMSTVPGHRCPMTTVSCHNFEPPEPRCCSQRQQGSHSQNDVAHTSEQASQHKPATLQHVTVCEE